jgi:Flp pilus assembly protein TadD
MMSKLIRTAASTLVIGALTVGCSSVHTVRPFAAAETRGGQRAAESYRDAQNEMKRGNMASAIDNMENAVAQSPNDAGYRMTLAELYLKSGRFVSAETTFADVVAIRPDDSRAGFYLAVSQIAQGKAQAAIDQLRGMDASAAPADIGLAYALAGDSHRALALLEPAAQAPTANGRVRQNLALAYALSGDWKKARLVASQDVAPNELGKRMEQWAAIASPSANSARIATLLGVAPIDNDQGQPARLALRSSPSESIQAAAVEAAPAPADQPMQVAEAAVPAVVPVAVAESAPVAVAADVTAAAPVSEPVPIPAVYAEAAAQLINPEQSDMRRVIRATAQTFSRPNAHKATSRYVVQIGAFRSPAQVERAWAQSSRRYALDQGQQPLSTTVSIPGKGVFHRLSVAGFESPASARQLCNTIKTRGGMCFVRTLAGDAPVQWASRYTRKA